MHLPLNKEELESKFDIKDDQLYWKERPVDSFTNPEHAEKFNTEHANTIAGSQGHVTISGARYFIDEIILFMQQDEEAVFTHRHYEEYVDAPPEYIAECFELIDDKLHWRDRPRWHFKNKTAQIKFNLDHAGKRVITTEKKYQGTEIQCVSAFPSSIYYISDLISCLESPETVVAVSSHLTDKPEPVRSKLARECASFRVFDNAPELKIAHYKHIIERDGVTCIEPHSFNTARGFRTKWRVSVTVDGVKKVIGDTYRCDEAYIIYCNYVWDHNLDEPIVDMFDRDKAYIQLAGKNIKADTGTKPRKKLSAPKIEQELIAPPSSKPDYYIVNVVDGMGGIVDDWNGSMVEGKKYRDEHYPSAILVKA